MDKYYSSEQFRTILKKYEDMNKLGVSSYLDAEELTDVAEFYHMQGNIQQALEAVDMALRIFPGATTPIVFKARVALLIDNDIQKAYEMIEQIKDKSDIEYTYIKAETMLADYHAKEADSLLSERFNDFAGDKEDFILDAATLFADYDEYDLAEKWLSQSSLHEENDYKDVQARILMERGKYAESESLFNELIDRDPFSSVYWNRLASSQFMRNSIQESITSSEFSIAINPNDDEAILNKANGLFSLGNFEEALEYYKKFCLLQPANETGELFQGITLGNLDKPEEAIEHLEKALILARKTTNNIQQILQELAFHESRLGHVDKAMNYLDQNEKAGAD
ncbi:MAG: tetratricopeptide repeat protein, partial [Prevotella sp.]|nr:tetratricopeptide repeat protein [Prevotella sp.]